MSDEIKNEFPGYVNLMVGVLSTAGTAFVAWFMQRSKSNSEKEVLALTTQAAAEAKEDEFRLKNMERISKEIELAISRTEREVIYFSKQTDILRAALEIAADELAKSKSTCRDALAALSQQHRVCQEELRRAQGEIEQLKADRDRLEG